MCDTYEDICVTAYQAVRWLRRLVAGLSPERPAVAPGSVIVEFVDKASLGKEFLRVLRFPPVNIIPPGLRTLILPEDEQ
jgi:hypothetical protein